MKKRPSSPDCPTDVEPQAPPAALSVCVLASGSRGNAIWISDGATSVLFDAGLSGKEIEARMAARGLCPQSLTALVLSHEHTDHQQAVGVLSRRFGIRVLATEKTFRAASAVVKKPAGLSHFSPGKTFEIGSLSVCPFSTSHDAADPTGFTITGAGVKIGLATDLGVATNLVAHHLSGCRALLLESNHDPQMLQDGPYPWHLKQRVKGRTGHLSNQDSRDLLGRVLCPATSHVVLCHLSETNNTPETALSAVAPALSGHKAHLSAASQDRPGPLIMLYQ
ncbi:MAG: MBL fold metallo-hydrolase [Deltaproteobacteria bacterium]|nr:MBL fold metallo-hydrolase [Deltaproteobacteria bacterium]